MTLFHPGQRALCVAADQKWAEFTAAGPQPGRVYTVAAVAAVSLPSWPTFAWLTLQGFGGRTFDPVFFAPLADEGIDAFEALLKRALDEGPQP